MTADPAAADLVGAGLAPPIEGDDAQAERLAAERQAAAVDGEFFSVEPDAGAGPVGQVPAVVNPLEENRAILEVLVSTLTPALPFLPTCYPPPTIDNIARAYTAVEAKHGWNLRNAFSVEGVLLLTVLPPTLLAIRMGQEHFARRRAEAEAEAAAGTGARPEGSAPAPTPAPRPRPANKGPGIDDPQPNASSSMTRVL